MEEILPFLKIELFVENNEVNIESIQITHLIWGYFPISDIELLKQSILNVFDCSRLEDDWYEIQLRYKRDNEIGDYYEIVPFPYTKLPFKKVYSNE